MRVTAAPGMVGAPSSRGAMQRLVDAGGETGMDVVYGVAPARLRRFYVGHIDGAEHLVGVPFRTCRVGLRGLPEGIGAALAASSSARGEAPAGRYRVRPVVGFDGRWDALFARSAPAYGILVRRDAEYVDWRYRRCPDHRYVLVEASLHDRLVGWSAFRRQCGRLLWGDALFDPEHPAAATAVLTRVLRSREMSDVSVVHAWFRDRPAWWRRHLGRIGLGRAADPDDQDVICMCPAAATRAGGLSAEDLRRELYLTMGDADLF